MRVLRADHPRQKDYSVIRTFHDQVVALLNDVPSFLPHKDPDTSWDSEHPHLPHLREETLTMANLFLMTFNWSHIVASADTRRHALQAALISLESQQRFFEQASKRRYPHFALAFYTIDAFILRSIIMTLRQPDDQEVKRYIDSALQQVIERL